MPVGAAIAAAGVVGAGATIYSASQASKAQTSAADKSIAAQKDMFNQSKELQQPYIQGGYDANNELNALMKSDGSVDMEKLRQLPGYEFALQQGERGIENSASARGLGSSMPTAYETGKFATGLADQTYGNQVGRLMGRVQIGENAAAGTGANAIATGQGVGSSLTGQGNAQAGAYMAAGNAVGGLGSDLTSAYMASKLYGPGGVYAPKVASPSVGVGTYDPKTGMVG